MAAFFRLFLYILEECCGSALSTLFSCLCSYPLNPFSCASFPLSSLILKSQKSRKAY